MVGPANGEMVFVIKLTTREGCASERLWQLFHTGASFEVVLFSFFPLLATLLAQLDSLDNWLCDFLCAAVLFATSPSSRVCKSLHIWKHRQQGVGAGDHRCIRWVGGKSVTSRVFFLCLPESPRGLPHPPKNPKTKKHSCIFFRSSYVN